jgi:hypothetical protein
MESNGGGAANKRQRLPYSPAELACRKLEVVHFNSGHNFEDEGDFDLCTCPIVAYTCL